MRINSKFTFMVFLIGSILLAACGQSPPSAVGPGAPASTPYISHIPAPVSPSPSSTLISSNVPIWKLSPGDSNFALIVLDYQTLQFKGAYFEVHKRCDLYDDLKKDEDMIDQADNILGNTNEDLRFTFRHVGDFALYEYIMGNGAVILDPCTGQILFAASLDFPTGQVYPVQPIDPFEYEKGNRSVMQPMQPQRFDVITPSGLTIEGFDAAWDSVQSMNLVRDLSTFPHSVLIYLYADSSESMSQNEGEWLIFLHLG